MKTTLEKADLEAIADAIVAKLKDEGLVVAAGDAPAEAEESKPAKSTPAKGKSTPAKGKGTAAKKDEPEVDRAAVLKAVRDLGEAKGRDVAKGIVANYAESFGDVKDEDLPKLLAEIEAAASEDDDAGSSSDDDY